MGNKKIKKIEWGNSEDYSDSCSSGFYIAGHTVLGDYVISGDDFPVCPLCFEIDETPFEEIEDLKVRLFETLEAAKKACQDQFDRIIGGCIDE